MNNRNLPIIIDAVFCVILLPAMIMLLPIERWLTHHTGFVLLLVIWLYAVYFINRKWTVPMVFGKNRYLPAVIILAATVFLTWLLIRMDMPGDFFWHRGHAVHHRFFRLGPREQGVWFLFLVVTTFSVAVGLLTELYRQMLRRKELEQEKSRAELALYKAQINPHFLFNTLNTIYGMILTHSDRTEQAFMQFIGMVKYLYSKASSDFIPVTEEIDYIRQYIELQKNRLNEHTGVEFNADVSDSGAVIAPMLLITFVENAFKYGVSSHRDSVISISISADTRKLRFNVRNSVFPESLAKKGDGVGIVNCRKRLELIYPDAHELKLTDSGTSYEADLTIFFDRK